jgi:hypothetical protein
VSARARSPLAVPCVLGCAALVLLGCGRTERLEPCNIATEQCQTDVYYAVVRVRGDGWDPFDGLPPIRTITLAEYEKELKAQAAGDAEKPDAEPQVDPWSVALQLLGLVTPTMSSGEASVQSRVDNVAAFYSSSTGKVTVIDRGAKRDDRYETALLAHELVHAFQDNELSGAIGGGTSDGSFTGRAQIEGEAELYEDLIATELDGVEPQQVDWAATFRNDRDWLRSSMGSDPAPFYAVNWFVYSLGTNLMMRSWLEGGNAAVRDLGASFPRHSAILMAESDGETLDVGGTLSCDVRAPADGFELAGFDRFGGMQLYAFLAAGGGVEDAEAWKRGKRWRGDAIWVYLDKDSGRVAVTWRIRLADAKSAEVVVDAASQRDAMRAERVGDDALLVASDDADLLDTWAGAAKCKP